MIKSPLRYPGGKSRSVDKIASLVPQFKEFREPFLGGGSVFVHLKQKYPQKKFWVNDIYPELYYFWHHVQLELEGVLEQVLEWKTEFANGKELHKYLQSQMPVFNELQKASAFFVFNRITFSGTTEAGGYSEQSFQGRFTPSSIERLTPFAQVIQNAQITNLDYEELLTAAGEEVFIFLDPPYFSATKSALYGKNGSLHKGFDHHRFADALKNCKHNWLITYDDSPFIRELFSFAEITPWQLTYGMRNVVAGSNQKGNELFISNYSLFEIDKMELLLFGDDEIIYNPSLSNPNS